MVGRVKVGSIMIPVHYCILVALAKTTEIRCKIMCLYKHVSVNGAQISFSQYIWFFIICFLSLAFGFFQNHPNQIYFLEVLTGRCDAVIFHFFDFSFFQVVAMNCLYSHIISRPASLLFFTYELLYCNIVRERVVDLER